jgi:hypothetical protein
MVNTWKDPEGKDVPKEEFEKLIVEGKIPSLFVGKLIAACDSLLAMTDEDVTFLKTLMPQEARTA